MRQRQKGFTLLELVVAAGILAVIAGAIMMTTVTLLRQSDQDEAHVALQQVQNAGYWISRDVQMARNVTAPGPHGFPITISVPVDDNEANDYSIQYLFTGNKLQRHLYDSSGNLTAETFIADYIDTGNTAFVSANVSLYRLTIRAVKDERAVTMNYEVSQRL